jgi:hypothetical protein
MTKMTSMTKEAVVSAPKRAVAEAKAKFIERMKRANSDGLQTAARNSRTAAVIVTADDGERKSKRDGNLAEFFAASPLRGLVIKVKRLRGRPRQIDL